MPSARERDNGHLRSFRGHVPTRQSDAASSFACDNGMDPRANHAGDMNERSASRLSPSLDAAAATAVAPTSVAVRLLQSVEDLQRAENLLTEVWGGRAGEGPMALDIMCALSFTGGYVVGAFADEVMVGVTAGFRTVHGSLHSHVAGVLAPYRGLGVGRTMKQHQLAWAAERGMTSISWTFDPLIRRNAYFNLNRLGAVAERFIPDFYGPLADGINEGELTDRLFVSWGVESALLADVTDHDERQPALEAFEPLLDVGHDEHPLLRAAAGPLVRIATPADSEAMRQHDKAAAGRWRMLMRTALGAALSDGYRIVGFHPSGWYLLRRKDSAR